MIKNHKLNDQELKSLISFLSAILWIKGNEELSNELTNVALSKIKTEYCKTLVQSLKLIVKNSVSFYPNDNEIFDVIETFNYGHCQGNAYQDILFIYNQIQNPCRELYYKS